MKNLTLKILGVTLACLFISYVAAKLAGVERWPDELGRRYMVKLREGHEVSFDQEILIEGVDEIEIETVSTDINIEQVQGDDVAGKLHAKFTGPDHLGFTTMRAGDKLYLKVANKAENKNAMQWNFDGQNNELGLSIPPHVKQVVIKTVSGGVEAKGLKGEKFSVAETSGDVHLEAAELKELETKSVSGDLRCERCAVGVVRASSVSGDQSLNLDGDAPQVMASSTSGDVELRFEKKPNARLQLATVSGDLALEPEYGKAMENARRVDLQIGSGKGLIAVKTVSGDVRIGRR